MCYEYDGSDLLKCAVSFGIRLIPFHLSVSLLVSHIACSLFEMQPFVFVSGAPRHLLGFPQLSQHVWISGHGLRECRHINYVWICVAFHDHFWSNMNIEWQWCNTSHMLARKRSGRGRSEYQKKEIKRFMFVTLSVFLKPFQRASSLY